VATISTETLQTWRGRLTSDQRDRYRELWVLGGDVVHSTSRRSWAGLLYAVGNMKRSAGNIHPVPFETGDDAPTRRDRMEVTVESSSGATLMSAEDASTLSTLTNSVRGIGPATGSMVLASMWPMHHATFDRLTRHVAAAVINDHVGWDPVQGAPPQPSSDGYAGWYLPTVRAEAERRELPLWQLEQALFAAGQLTNWPAWDSETSRWQPWLEDLRARVAQP
jgi:hypothetical protein